MSLKKEKRTVKAMIDLYCKSHHGGKKELCHDCSELQKYAMTRLNRCPYSEKKPACSKCTTHCYKPDMRDQVRIVMRWSGPRMLLHHPLLAIDHLFKTFR